MTHPSILKPGDTCWRREEAARLTFLVDGADYFQAVRETLKQARHSAWVIGWDIDSRFELIREPAADGLPVRFGEFLRRLVRDTPQLHVYVLNWEYSIIYAPEREWLPIYKMEWTSPRRLHFHMDSRHPLGASHHQKIVVVDDQVAFVGGLDFTLGRWDTPEHDVHDPRRRDLNETIPQPYHDVQVAVSGDIARALGDLARKRWHQATGQQVRAAESLSGSAPWPPGVAVDIEEVMVGIARTYPVYKDQGEVREIERLLLAAIGAARKMIYLENQYFTALKIGEALARRLEEDDGPEIVIILPEETTGWLSHYTMDVLRERLLKQLVAADHHDRLRLYYPLLPDLGQQCLNVHSKVLIIDNELIRIGSANYNNRSMGLDTECDLALEAGGQERLRTAIAAFRNRLLAEHLAVSPAAVDEAMAQEQSLIRAIESLHSPGRTLSPLPFRISKEVDDLVPDFQIADPEQPIDPDQLARGFIDDKDKRAARGRLIIMVAILGVALLLAAAWRWTPLKDWLDINKILNNLATLRGSWQAPLIVAALSIVGGLLVFPVTLMIIATGVAFGAFYGFAYALLGAEVSALVTYALGHHLGQEMIRNLSQRWVSRLSRRLARRGVLSIITLRVVPVAPFSVINLMAGASHISLRDFILGTLVGMAPGILALTFFSDQVVSAIQAPEASAIATLLALAVAIGLTTWAVSRWLLKRQKRTAKKQSSREAGE
ncbi:MAG: VTT domain-containing protein [Deltaproteobacteria bacterium]|jgi:phospholipase D1/2|nr:VTT domain-containing protein [Deltaproteobacteria bacterium]